MSATYEEAFLEDVVAHPDDDAPRLIYADWLDEQGDSPRAEFIRVQHALAELPPGDPRRTPLLKRQGILLGDHEGQWRASLPELDGVTWADFSRGFVEAVFVEDVPTLLEQAPSIFAAAPVLRVQIGAADVAAAYDLARWPLLSRLHELNLGNNQHLGERGVAALAGSPHLKRLRVLLLHYCELGDEAVARLAHAAVMPRLTELYLSGNSLGDAAAFALADTTSFPRLAELDLRDNQIGDAGARALAHQSCLEGLVTLYLVNNRIGPEGAEALAFSACLPRLAHLFINYNRLGDAGASAFAASPARSALRELDLRHCEVRTEGARALADSPHLDGLELLWLGGNRIQLEALKRLRQRFGEGVRF
jgi:uncharacterized protein (TIGR02996 family)